jgi:aromatic ring-opening dioxygenase catalytic subunit (LigB family)
MADVVLGIGHSHTPQISVNPEEWPNLGKTEQPSPHIPDDLDAQLQLECFKEKHARVQGAIKQLSQLIQSTPVDAIVIFGDDQHEQFHDDNMPSVAIYHGERVEVHPRTARPGGNFPTVHLESTASEYPNSQSLAEHLINSLTEQEFDVTRTNQLKAERGIGHAFSFLYQRLWPACDVPIVPIMVNTYYPPNQPTPKRCHDLGKAVRTAVGTWKNGERVAVLASGGLSHIVIDEPLDVQVLDALKAHDTRALHAIPRELLKGGTSEILNWVALDGAVGSLPMTLIDYIPGYRSRPSTGCAMAFAYWS